MLMDSYMWGWLEYNEGMAFGFAYGMIFGVGGFWVYSIFKGWVLDYLDWKYPECEPLRTSPMKVYAPNSDCSVLNRLFGVPDA
jgi:hypothetical protein